MVAVVWGGKDGFAKPTQTGFCSKDPRTDSGLRAMGTQGAQSQGRPKTAGPATSRGEVGAKG